MEGYGGEELLALILDLLVVEGRLEHKHRSLYLWGEWRGVMVSTCMRQVEGRLEHEHRSLYLMREVIREVIRGHQRSSEHRSLYHVGDAQSELEAREVCKPKPQLVALLHGRMLLL